jgi:phage terminase small subunit
MKKISKRLTCKQKKFADNYLETGNATQSTLMAGYDVKDNFSAAVIGNENLKKINIEEYLREHAGNAMTRIEEMSRTAINETVKLNANKDIMDRAGYKPTDKSELKITELPQIINFIKPE